MVTKDDCDLVEALFAKATSVKFVGKILDVKNSNSIRCAKTKIDHKLTKYHDIANTSQVVRNNMTNESQRRLTKRIMEQRKQKMFKLQCETRGRQLKSDIFPELKFVLEEIFSCGSANDGIAGGLESHPRLQV